MQDVRQSDVDGGACCRGDGQLILAELLVQGSQIAFLCCVIGVQLRDFRGDFLQPGRGSSAPQFNPASLQPQRLDYRR